MNSLRRSSARRLLSSIALAFVAPLAVPAATVRAQNATPKSQLGVVTQWVAGTKIEITYRRPVARGRALFGALVPYGKMWTPSADTAARIATSAPITINGASLPAGVYSMWVIPEESSWAIKFNSVANAFHLTYPAGRDVMEVKATPAHGGHVETLEFAFPMTDADSARLEIRWGTTVVPLSIKAKP